MEGIEQDPEAVETVKKAMWDLSVEVPSAAIYAFEAVERSAKPQSELHQAAQKNLRIVGCMMPRGAVRDYLSKPEPPTQE